MSLDRASEHGKVAFSYHANSQHARMPDPSFWGEKIEAHNMPYVHWIIHFSRKITMDFSFLHSRFMKIQQTSREHPKLVATRTR
jgi:hypothetical protein